MKAPNLPDGKTLLLSALITALLTSMTTFAVDTAPTDPLQPVTCAGFYFGCGAWDNTGSSSQCPYMRGIDYAHSRPTQMVSTKAYQESSAAFVAKIHEYQLQKNKKDSAGHGVGEAAKETGGYAGLAVLAAAANPILAVTLVVAAPVMLVKAPLDHHRKTTWLARATVAEVLWEADLHLYDGPGIQVVTDEVKKQIPTITPIQVADLLASEDAPNGPLCNTAKPKTKFSVKTVQQLAQLVTSQIASSRTN